MCCHAKCLGSAAGPGEVLHRHCTAQITGSYKDTTPFSRILTVHNSRKFVFFFAFAFAYDALKMICKNDAEDADMSYWIIAFYLRREEIICLTCKMLVCCLHNSVSHLNHILYYKYWSTISKASDRNNDEQLISTLQLQMANYGPDTPLQLVHFSSLCKDSLTQGGWICYLGSKGWCNFTVSL